MTTTLMPNPVEFAVTESQMDAAEVKGRKFMKTAMFGLAAAAFMPAAALVVAPNGAPVVLGYGTAADEQNAAQQESIS